MRVLDNGILHINYPKGVEIDETDIRDIQKGYDSLPYPKPLKILQELELHVNMTADARKYAAEHSPDLTGVAYVIKSLGQRLLIRFYVRMWKRDKPIQVFESYKEALEWLECLEQ